MISEKYVPLNVRQLKELIEDCDDESKIRIWVEMYKGDAMILEGRRLISVIDDPNDEYVCLIASYYTEDNI